MDPRATGASVFGFSHQSLADNGERMEDYLHHSNRAPTHAASPSESSCSSPDHLSVSASSGGVGEVFEAIPITWALHRLENGRVYDELGCSLTPEEIEQFRKE